MHELDTSRSFQEKYPSMQPRFGLENKSGGIICNTSSPQDPSGPSTDTGSASLPFVPLMYGQVTN